MKKRHQQKLVILSIVLLLLLNLPIVFIFNTSESILGIPVLYAYIFLVWMLSVVFTYLIINRYDA